MRAPRPSGFCSSCPQPGPPLHRAVLQRISIQNTILVHHPAATVHQHNPALQSPFTLADNSQPYPGQPHFLTGTHIVMKAASCKIASRHPQTVTHEKRTVECLPHTPGLYPEQSKNGEKIYLHRGTVPGLTRWELVATTTMLPDIAKPKFNS